MNAACVLTMARDVNTVIVGARAQTAAKLSARARATHASAAAAAAKEAEGKVSTGSNVKNVTEINTRLSGTNKTLQVRFLS